MAIKFKSSLGYEELFNHLKLDYSKEYFQSKKIDFDLGISEIRVIENLTHNLLATIKPGVLISKIKNTAPSDDLYVFTRKLIAEVLIRLTANPGQALGICDAGWLSEMTDKPYTYESPTTLVESSKISVNIQEATAPAPVIINTSMGSAVVENLVATFNEIQQGQRVPLRDATRLYQPVKGTSSDARYYVVGISKDGVKIAIKKPAESISVRVESDKPIEPTLMTKFDHFGIAGKGSHLSGHFHLHHANASRFVGALLVDLGLEWKTPLPNLKLLEVAP